MVKSPRFSFKGYKFSEALYRNKDLLKGVVVLVTGVTSFVGFNWRTFGMSVGAALLGLVGKLVLDAFDYFFTEVDL